MPLSVKLADSVTVVELVGLPEALKLLVTLTDSVAMAVGVPDGEGVGE